MRDAASTAYERTQAWNQYPQSPRSIEPNNEAFLRKTGIARPDSRNDQPAVR